MVEAVYFDRHNQYDTDVDIVAWQTSLLMNATGNFKQKITPDMLLKKNDESNEGEGESKPKSSRLEKEEKDRLVGELLAKFK